MLEARSKGAEPEASTHLGEVFFEEGVGPMSIFQLRQIPIGYLQADKQRGGIWEIGRAHV